MKPTDDINDTLCNEGENAARERLENAKRYKREGPQPLMRELPPADPFPVDALIGILGDAVRAIHDRVQAPLALCAQSTLGAAALVAQGRANVVLPTTGVAVPISLYLITVGVSGERKSTCDKQAMWEIEKYEKTLRENYDGEFLAFQNDKLAWDEARDKAKKNGKGNRAVIKEAFDALGPPPAAPCLPIITCPEPTYEGLYKLFAAGYPSLGLFSTEGGQFIVGNGMNKDNKAKTAAGLSHLWDGEPMKRVRAGDGASVLPIRRLSMHLMAQPLVADILLGDSELIDQGITSRMLVTAPDTAIGTRLWRDEQQHTDNDLRRFWSVLLKILELPLPLVEGKSNELALI